MMVLVAFLIAVVAISLMMTVLVASTRPLRAYDEPVYGTRSNSNSKRFNRNPNWTDLDGTAVSNGAPRAAHPIEQYTSALPIPAPVPPAVSGTTGSPIPSNPIDALQSRPAPRSSGRVNPNAWGRVRAEVGILETRRHRAV